MRKSLPSRESRTNSVEARHSIFKRSANARILACGIATILTASTGWSAVFHWNGAGEDDKWTTAANWGGANSTPPIGFLSPSSDFAADLQFGVSTRLTPNVDINDPFQIKSLTFNAGAPAYTFTGNAIAFQAGVDVAINDSSNLQTFDVGIVLAPTGGANYVWKSNSAGMKFNGNVTLTTNQTATFTARGGQNVTVDGLISNTLGTLNVARTDGGTLALTNDNNSFIGTLRASTGVVSITSIANKGVNSAAGRGDTIILGQNQNGTIGVGRLLFLGANGGSSDRTIRLDTGVNGTNLNGGFIIENGVAGKKLTLSGDVLYYGSAPTTHGTMTLQGVGNGELSGNIQTTGASMTKSGTGTWTLSGATNTYGGGTTVSQGTLLVNNVTGSGTGTGAVTVNATLGGTGRIAPTGTNGFTINATGWANLSGDNATDDLVLDLAGTGNASFASGAKFKFDLAATNVSDVFAFRGLGDSTVAFNNNVIDFTSLGGLVEGNSYTLFTFDTPGKYTGQLAVGAGLGALAGTLTYNPTSIVLTVIPEPGTAAMLLGGIGMLVSMQRRRRC